MLTVTSLCVLIRALIFSRLFLFITKSATHTMNHSAWQLSSFLKAITADMSDEELGKVAGGTTPVCLMTGLSILIVGTAAYNIITHETHKDK